MHGEIVRRYRVFFAWQDEDEERWLRSKARDEGLHLLSYTPPCVYRFRRGERADYAYRLDFQTTRRQDKADYLQLFADAGWEHVGEMGSWHYFRRPVTGGEAPEIFTDPESKAQKYRRVLALFVVFLVPWIAILNSRLWERHASALTEVLRFLCFLGVLFWTYTTLRLTMRVGALTKQAKRGKAA
jgi:hypothetical protein